MNLSLEARLFLFLNRCADGATITPVGLCKEMHVARRTPEFCATVQNIAARLGVAFESEHGACYLGAFTDAWGDATLTVRKRVSAR